MRHILLFAAIALSACGGGEPEPEQIICPKEWSATNPCPPSPYPAKDG